MRILWACAIGSAVSKYSLPIFIGVMSSFPLSCYQNHTFNMSPSVLLFSQNLIQLQSYFSTFDNYNCLGLYMVAVERQAQNRQRMLAEELKAMESGERRHDTNENR